MYYIGDKVRVNNKIFNGEKGAIRGISGSGHLVEFDEPHPMCYTRDAFTGYLSDDNKLLYVQEEDLELVETSLRLYDLFEIYSKPENRHREFEDEHGDIYRYRDWDNSIVSQEEIDIVDWVLNSRALMNVKVWEVDARTPLTVEQIEEKLGYKIEVIED